MLTRPWWIARIMVTWGLISGAMALVNSPTMFSVLRFLPEAAEAGFIPGVLLPLGIDHVVGGLLVPAVPGTVNDDRTAKEAVGSVR